MAACKKRAFIIFYAFAANLLWLRSAIASPTGGIDINLEDPLGSGGDLIGLFAKILDLMVKIGLPIIILAIVYSGFLFLFAQGQEDKIKTARKAFFWSVIGGVVLIGAEVLARAIGTTIQQLGSGS